MDTDPHHNRRTLADLTDEESEALAAMLADITAAFAQFTTTFQGVAESIQDNVYKTWESLEPLRKTIANAQLDDATDDDETQR